MSGFLLDTHAFIWLTENDSSLPDNLRMMINSADIVYLSIASLWAGEQFFSPSTVEYLQQIVLSGHQPDRFTEVPVYNYAA